MKIDKGGDRVTFESTGRRAYVAGLIVGMTIDGDLQALSGHDGGIDLESNADETTPDKEWEDAFTLRPEERRELASLMIERWKAFAAQTT